MMLSSYLSFRGKEVKEVTAGGCHMDRTLMMTTVDRRIALSSAAVMGAGIALSACGAGSEAAESGAKPSAPAADDGSIGSAADVPVGGGLIYDDESVVVTQPEEGVFKAFSAVCPHQGCQVSEVQNSAILCVCHGSSFSIADGSVLDGPAPSPLPEKKVTAEDGKLMLG